MKTSMFNVQLRTLGQCSTYWLTDLNLNIPVKMNVLG
jgi:hypothetical protein